MSTGKARDPRKERFWRRMLRQWGRSDLSARTFCELHGLSQASLYAWRRTLADRDRQDVHFLPVEVLSQAKPVDPARDGAAAGLELMLNGGRLLRIGPGFDGPTLQRLLTLLEGGQP